MSKPGPKTQISKEKITVARNIIDNLPYSNSVVSAFVVLLEAQGKLTQAEIASIAGISVATVKRISGAPLQPKGTDFTINATSGWGGDRRSFFSGDAAKNLLDQFAEDATNGNLVTVDKIKCAVEAQIGHPVTVQTVYNLLNRHHWRKVTPDKVHPKNDPEKLEEFKKKPFRKRFGWLPPKPEDATAL